MPNDSRDASESPATALSVSEFESMVSDFVDRALSFANSHCPPQDIHEAWRAFRVWLSSWVDYNSDDWRLFLVWYVFQWFPAEASGGGESAATIAEQYLKARPTEISDEERAMVKTAIRGPLDFYEIHPLEELNCIYVKSLFLGYQHSYAFSGLPDGLKVGDIFFGKIIQIRDDQGVIAGHSRPFPATAKIAIAYLRRELIKGRKEEFVRNFSLFDSDLFNLYHDLLSGRAKGF